MSKTVSKIAQTTVTKKVKANRKSAKTLESTPIPITSRSHSKQAIIIGLLRHPQGVTIDELMTATGWQRHSVHGTLSGVIKKRLGLPLMATREERGVIYRLA
jgi:hypothetical protein